MPSGTSHSFGVLVRLMRQVGTVTRKVQVAGLPQASTAVTVTVVSPTPKMWPDVTTAPVWSRQTTCTGPEQASVAVGVKVAEPLHCAVMLSEHEITGGVVSTAVRVFSQLLLQPLSFATVSFRVHVAPHPEGSTTVTVCWS